MYWLFCLFGPSFGDGGVGVGRVGRWRGGGERGVRSGDETRFDCLTGVGAETMELVLICTY